MKEEKKKIKLSDKQIVIINHVSENCIHSDDDATATAADILNGKTAYVKGEKITGTLNQTPAIEHEEWIKFLNGTIEQVVIPDEITKINEYAFYSYAHLKTINLNHVTEIGAYSFAGCRSLTSTSLGEGLLKVDAYAFMNVGFTEIHIPSTVQEMGTGVHKSNRALQKVTFLGTPKTISDTVFATCLQLKEINVPWKEGAVAGAPWGATSATINYEVVG